ncbi:metal-sulfur cluster assembly factor [Acidobacteria bacterium AB60]|nr:metal-sulfur cluster assembly factor [Acidobacteria bacterium AB60]
MLNESQILAALRDCFDPEMKVNLVDLGLIYAVETGADPDSAPAWPRQWVKVTLTLPKPESHGNGLVLEQVSNRLAGIPEISRVDVKLVWEPPWTPRLITEEGRRQLGLQAGLVSISSAKAT